MSSLLFNLYSRDRKDFKEKGSRRRGNRENKNMELGICG